MFNISAKNITVFRNKHYIKKLAVYENIMMKHI